MVCARVHPLASGWPVALRLAPQVTITEKWDLAAPQQRQPPLGPCEMDQSFGEIADMTSYVPNCATSKVHHLPPHVGVGISSTLSHATNLRKDSSRTTAVVTITINTQSFQNPAPATDDTARL